MNQKTIAVVGLGYESKIANYRKGDDPSWDISSEDFRATTRLSFTCDPAHLASADFVGSPLILVAHRCPVTRGLEPVQRV